MAQRESSLLWSFERGQGLLSRSCRKRMASIAMTGYLMVFLELWRNVWGFSRVTTGNSGSLSCGPREVQSPFEL